MATGRSSYLVSVIRKFDLVITETWLLIRRLFARVRVTESGAWGELWDNRRTPKPKSTPLSTQEAWGCWYSFYLEIRRPQHCSDLKKIHQKESVYKNRIPFSISIRSGESIAEAHVRIQSYKLLWSHRYWQKKKLQRCNILQLLLVSYRAEGCHKTIARTPTKSLVLSRELNTKLSKVQNKLNEYHGCEGDM